MKLGEVRFGGSHTGTPILSPMSNTFVIRNIANDDGSALIGDHGAHVINWAPSGQTSVIWQPKAVRLCAQSAVRGGIPVIFPWFNAGFANGQPTNKTPRHGFARLSFWHVDKESMTDRHIQYTLDTDDVDAALLDQIISGANSRFHAAYDVTVGTELTVALTVTNTGDDSLVYESALHTYFHVGDVTYAHILGLRGAHYLDATVDGFPEREQSADAVTFNGSPVDRVYDTTDELQIHDDVLDRTIVIETAGSSQTVVWNPGATIESGSSDLGETEWRDFVCVEAAACRDHAVTLAPGASHTLSQTIRLV
ncbi:D-hexose-6-phosphate mutarotase [Bifidobacterium hapali]|uniref:Putative glucose-6-phosphate 1-epimerase n=2 Tax=Bifidobacterium hapali TaxID=1630172 RepID=A0A261G4L6_9BIFI|nr:D-hexose-6-phosphate mutarotase [Bifidobacterium hapali]